LPAPGLAIPVGPATPARPPLATPAFRAILENQGLYVVHLENAGAFLAQSRAGRLWHLDDAGPFTTLPAWAQTPQATVTLCADITRQPEYPVFSYSATDRDGQHLTALTLWRAPLPRIAMAHARKSVTPEFECAPKDIRHLVFSPDTRIIWPACTCDDYVEEEGLNQCMTIVAYTKNPEGDEGILFLDIESDTVQHALKRVHDADLLDYYHLTGNRIDPLMIALDLKVRPLAQSLRTGPPVRRD
jgi:hypothetical protein